MITIEATFVSSGDKWLIFDKEMNIIGAIDEEDKFLWNIEFATKNVLKTK